MTLVTFDRRYYRMLNDYDTHPFTLEIVVPLRVYSASRGYLRDTDSG